MASFPITVRGFITRLYPGGDRLYFHVFGDQAPRGFAESDYNFILYTAPNSQATYQLLLKAAEHRWILVVKRSDSMEKHVRIDEQWVHYNVDYVYVDL